MGSPTKFGDITVGQQNCKVFGRLIRLWDAKNKYAKNADSLFSIDGVLLAEDGAMVQMTIPKKVEKQFRPLLSLGSVYMLTDVSAVHATYKKFIYHHQSYMLQFKTSSKVHLMQLRGASIPRFAFDFSQFDQLPSKDKQSKPLLDLIGVISYIGPYDYASPTSQYKLRKIHIRNQDEQTQEINLLGEDGETFDESTVLSKSDGKIVVCVFAGLTVGKYLDKLEASSSSATKIYIDMEIPEVEQYKKSYQWEVPVLSRQLPQITHVTPLQAAGKLYKLEEISTLPNSSFEGGASFSCIATVEALLQSNKWYYKVCKSCGEGYNNNSDTPRCSCPLSDPKPMYKLALKITDDTASMDTIAFSLVTEDLLEQTAMQASQNMKIDASDHAVALEKAIGKKRLFSIGMNTKYFSRFSINHVLKRSYKIQDDTSHVNENITARQNSVEENIIATSEDCQCSIGTPPTVLPSETTSKQNSVQENITATSEDVSTPDAAPPIKRPDGKSKTKRQLDFDNDNDVNKLRKPRTEEKASSKDSK